MMEWILTRKKTPELFYCYTDRNEMSPEQGPFDAFESDTVYATCIHNGDRKNCLATYTGLKSQITGEFFDYGWIGIDTTGEDYDSARDQFISWMPLPEPWRGDSICK